MVPILTNSRKTGLISIPPLAQPFSSFFANLVCVLSKSCEMHEKIIFSIFQDNYYTFKKQLKTYYLKLAYNF